MTKGILLINLGTPDSPEPQDVKNYLDEFLMDPYVIDVPSLFRWLLVKGIILRTRPKKSSEAYKKIWSERGSPLLFHSEDLVTKVQKILGSEYRVVLGMRYGKPSLETALKSLKDSKVSEISVLPLYPQYSLAATESSVQRVRILAEKLGITKLVKFFGAFYEHPAFIEAFRQVGAQSLKEDDYDFVLFSFHGVPERHVKKTDPSDSHCLATPHCCDKISSANQNCSRAQCYATARALAKGLGLSPEKYSVSFQSRLGVTPWIQPFTDVLYKELANKGVKNLLIFCPAFVADCLETLEEICIRGEQSFQSYGGKKLRLVPSLNSSEGWVKAVADILGEKTSAPSLQA